ITLGPIGQSMAVGRFAPETVRFEAGSVAAKAVKTSSDQIFLADNITLTGDLETTGSGALTLAPLGAGITLGIGNGALGDLLDNLELAHIQDGFSSINLGNASTVAIDVHSTSFRYTVIAVT